MRLWIISDTHWGVHSTQLSKWNKVIADFHSKFFIPLLEKEWKEGDRILHLGDVFDDRSRIDLEVHNLCLDHFQELSKRGFMVDVIVGNHDVYRRGDNSIHSLKMIDRLPGLTIHTEPIRPKWMPDILLMPWVEWAEEERKILANNKSAMSIFCHSELKGSRMSMRTPIVHDDKRNVVSLEDFNKKPVYSGHIHIRQKTGQFTFVGSPYHMDRNDCGDQKGIYCLEFGTGIKETFWPNTFSPQFVNKKISTIADLVGLTEEMQNNWVELTIEESAIADKKTRKGLEHLLETASPSGVNYIGKKELTEADAPDIIAFDPGSDLMEVSLDYIREVVADPRAEEIVKAAFKAARN